MDTKTLRDLTESYYSMYEPEILNEEEIEESEIGDRARRVVGDQRSGYHGDADVLNKTRNTLDRPVLKSYPGGFPAVKGASKTTKKTTQVAHYEPEGESVVEAYDIILKHLLDEGFASTVEDAEAIMTAMSAEWAQDIVEQTARIDYVQDKFNRENQARSGSAHTDIPGKQSTGKALQKAKESARQMGKLEGV
jgi:hypothetical protein